MSLISEIICYLYKDDRNKMINICLEFVKSIYIIINNQKITRKSNFFEVYFFVMCVVIRRYFWKRSKMIAEYQIDLFIKELFYHHIWFNYIEKDRKIATQLFDLSDYALIDNITIESLFPIFTRKLTERIEYYTYSFILDKDDKSYNETIKSFIDLTFGFNMINGERESLRFFLSQGIISNAINIADKTF